MNKEKENYHIVVTIKGKKHKLLKVGPPDFLSMETFEPLQKTMLLSYVISQFKDLINDKSDVSNICYKIGNKNIYNFKY